MFPNQILRRLKQTGQILCRCDKSSNYLHSVQIGRFGTVDKRYFADTDYKDYLDLSNKSNDTNMDRFMSINDRKDTSALPTNVICDIQLAKDRNSFKSVPILKDPFDEVILREMIFDIKPATIFEFGTFTGSSASYMAMLLHAYGLNKSKIITFDKFEEYRNKSIDDPKYIEYVICDLNDDWNEIDALKKDALLNKYEHPWLIIEDSHCNLGEILNYFDANGMQKGDYIVIEDTSPGIPDQFSENKDIKTINEESKKLNALREWMEKNESKGYRVDSKYCDLWGYNVTWNANGYIAKIE